MNIITLIKVSKNVLFTVAPWVTIQKKSRKYPFKASDFQ